MGHVSCGNAGRCSGSHHMSEREKTRGQEPSGHDGFDKREPARLAHGIG